MNINYTKVTVTNEQDAREFLSCMIDALGLGFHPDTLIADYCDDKGEATFGSLHAAGLQSLLDRCFEVLGDEQIYHISYGLISDKGLFTKAPKPKAPKKPSKTQQRLALLEAARELQGQFWDALGELEDALGVEIDQTLDLNDYDLDDLKQAAKA